MTQRSTGLVFEVQEGEEIIMIHRSIGLVFEVEEAGEAEEVFMTQTGLVFEVEEAEGIVMTQRSTVLVSQGEKREAEEKKIIKYKTRRRKNRKTLKKGQFLRRSKSKMKRN